jgi:hypothetical protein
MSDFMLDKIGQQVRPGDWVATAANVKERGKLRLGFVKRVSGHITVQMFNNYGGSRTVVRYPSACIKVDAAVVPNAYVGKTQLHNKKLLDKAVRIGKVAHEVIRSYNEVLGVNLPSWENLTVEHRTSTISDVLGVLNNTIKTPKDKHNAWLTHKRNAGWTWGTTKNAERKTHPSMIPYDDISMAEQTKDSLFFAVVDSMRNS